MSLSDPAGDVDGSFIANTSAKVGRWREHIEHHLKFDTQHITPLLSSPAKFLPPPTYAVPCDSPSGRKTTDARQKVRNNKAPGEDGVPDEICWSCVDTLAPSLHEVIEQAWTNEAAPDDWDFGILLPIRRGQCTR
ncbi:hypothetical protein SprV_1002911300 [Sparganum proliferum]